jgi:hypothetical protein
VKNPWSKETLPKCLDCHDKSSEGSGDINLGIFGWYINSRGHQQDNILCTTCHGAPHAVYPSTLPLDNAPIENIQGYDGTLRNCQVCHVGTNRDLSGGNFYHDSKTIKTK